MTMWNFTSRLRVLDSNDRENLRYGVTSSIIVSRPAACLPPRPPACSRRCHRHPPRAVKTRADCGGARSASEVSMVTLADAQTTYLHRAMARHAEGSPAVLQDEKLCDILDHIQECCQP